MNTISKCMNFAASCSVSSLACKDHLSSETWPGA